MTEPPSLRRNVFHLVALSAFAVAQPLFDLWTQAPEFFLVRGVDGIDVLFLTAVVSFAPAIALGFAEWAVQPFGRRPLAVLHAAFVALLGGLFVAPLLNRHATGSAFLVLAIAAAAGLALAVAYVARSGVRALVGWLAPAALVFPALFLFRPPMSTILFPPRAELGGATVENDVPIVMIVFDEFPSFALVDSKGEIDAKLFPNFARLAREGTWFRNATTVASKTPSALAAILTGNLQGRNPLDAPENRARNLFTLLGGSYELNVTESYVPYCPPSLCRRTDRSVRSRRVAAMLADAAIVLLHVLSPPEWADRLPTLAYASLLVRSEHPSTSPRRGLRLTNRGNGQHWSRSPVKRAEAFERFIASIAPGERPGLHYLHVLLPHVPYVFEPSGHICAGWELSPSDRWYDIEDPEVMQQRLLMQVGWLDMMIGRLLAHLERVGMYDRALLVLVADHGISFRPSVERRAVSTDNACDILSIPLFMKLPGQRSGGIDDRNVEIIDILPTIGAAVGIAIPWPVTGQSALALGAERAKKTFVGPSWPSEEAMFRGRTSVDFARDFGRGCLLNDRPNPTVASGEDDQRIFRVGPFGSLVGHEVGALRIAADQGVRVRLSADLSPPVARDAPVVPCFVEGAIAVSEGSAEGLPVAVAVNGTIRAVGETRRGPSDRPPPGAVPEPATFTVPVAGSAFRDQRNVVEVFVPRWVEGSVELVPADGAAASADGQVPEEHFLLGNRVPVDRIEGARPSS
jgi:hypothetical protein